MYEIIKWLVEVLYLPFQAIEESRLLRHARGGHREMRKIKMAEIRCIFVLLMVVFISISISWLIVTGVYNLLQLLNNLG